MPINEPQLNGRIATLLDRMNVRWRVLGETHGAFQGSQRQPDMLVHQQGGRPVVIENEYLPARTLEVEAVARLGESLDSSVAGVAGKINAVVALRSPLDLNWCNSHDEVDALLSGGVTLEYALYTGPQPEDYLRFPKQGFIPGNLRELAAFVAYASVPEDAVQQAIETLVAGIGSTAVILREACELSDSTKEAVAEQLKQDYSDQTLRMASTIMINALVFHLSLSGQPGVGRFDDIRPQGVPVPGLVIEAWHKILSVNYWSIFKIALELLRGISSMGHARDALREMVSTAEQLDSLGVAQSHDLTGTVFQRLIADRKFLATFYTRPESATLLAHLAIPDDGQWGDPERLRSLRIADYACGTGTLIHAAYRRVNQLHLLSGGDPEELHAHMMKEALTACDVLPSAVHLTASMLSSSHPRQRYDGTRTIVAQYGKTEDGGVSIGSLDLLGTNGEVRPLIPLHAGTTVTGTGEIRAEDSVEMPQYSQDLVIMNPPFTRSGSDWEGDARESDYIKPFRGLGTDLRTQRRMSDMKSKHGKDTCAHGYAGIASWFVALADRMVKHDGTIALVLPMTALQGTSWLKVRQLIAENYSDVIIITIATPKHFDQSFSADTGMAETLIVCRRSVKETSRRGVFVSLKNRPNNEMEAMEIARMISGIASNSDMKRLEDGPYGGTPLRVGRERVGQAIDAPLSSILPWSAPGISDFSVIQSAYKLSQGAIWLPQMGMEDKIELPIATIQQISQIGVYHRNIVGNSPQAAFEHLAPASNFPTYPMLWNHDAQKERCLVVRQDSEGLVVRGQESRAAEIWARRSHAHHNADFGFGSQPLAVAFTEDRTIGGRAWPNVKFASRAHEVAYSLWGNSTLGLVSYWWHSSRQQSGRGIMPISAIRTMPTLDVTKLSEDQLKVAKIIFEDMRDREFLPANEAWRDESRKELDRRVLVELLGLPESVLEPLDLLRLKWCSEPSVHGGKGTRPEGV